jgi:hypothetical protein
VPEHWSPWGLSEFLRVARAWVWFVLIVGAILLFLGVSGFFSGTPPSGGGGGLVNITYFTSRLNWLRSWREWWIVARSGCGSGCPG